MMRLFLSLMLGFALAAPAGAEPAKPSATLNAALDDVRVMVETAPGELGLVVAVTDRERLLLVATHGYADIDTRRPVTADTRFAIGSISKSFTAITLLQLADEGRFDPQAPIARYLPDFHPRSTFPAITGHALMTHTAGLPNYLTNVASMRFLVAALNDFEPRYAPGAHFWYSNSGYQLLGYAAERIEQRPFPLVLKHRVLDRLGMAATEPQIDDRLQGAIATSYVRLRNGSYAAAPWFDYLAADGAIVSTGADMSAYARMLLARGDTPKGRLISARAFDRFATAVLEDYGYGIDVKEHGQVLAHGGSIAGFEAYLRADLAHGVGIVFLSNGPLDDALRDRIIARLTQGASGQPKAAPKVGDATDSEPQHHADATNFAGRFIGRKDDALVFAADATGGLRLEEVGAGLPLTRLGNDSWGLYLTAKGPRAFTFFRNASGVVTDVAEGVSGYARPGSGVAIAEAPIAYRPLVGRYKAHGEEGQGVRIFVRNGRLMLTHIDGGDDALPLDADGPTRFRFARPAFSPEWLAFDTVIDGQVQRLTMSGAPLYRIDLP
ncbi:serine hydrolase domain-containing protein [Sphingomonas sp. ERG5]|uniref:serine hydrolase domain-containing protein n=1 Tax=Sphingomonas sp. ERG5 TaxID=1381597 RepID=UPI000A9B68B2|nr:serine hydrolase domain-containing protein [Sphingomonas sp. ERG5]